MDGHHRTTSRIAPLRLVVVELVIVAALLGAVEGVLVVASPIEPAWVVVLFPLVAEIYVAAGAIAWVRRPSNRMGALLVLGGLAWLAAALSNTDYEALVAVGMIFATVPLAVVVHMVLAFPSGCLRDRQSVVITVGGYLAAIVLQVPLYVFAPESPPHDVLLIAERPDLVDVGIWVQRIVGSAVMLAASVVLVSRIRAASPTQRAVLGPLYVYGIAAVLFVPLSASVIRPALDLTVISVVVSQLIALGLVPIAFALSILRGGFARTAEIEELGAWLGTDEGGRPALRDALADALGDPSLRLAFWSDDADKYIDDYGRPVVVPEAGDGRAAVAITIDRRLVGAIEYDANLIQDTDLVHAAGSVVALALDRERLTAGLLASQEEIRQSRIRIMAAADEERQRIAHDLHDGLQSKLLLLAMEASRAGVTGMRTTIDDVVNEVRTLVFGVMSPVLIERGLYAATEDLADRMPIPVRLDVPATPRRLPPSIEQAAYFVVAETLSNAVKHSHAQALTVRLALPRTGCGSTSPTTASAGRRRPESASAGSPTGSTCSGAGSPCTAHRALARGSSSRCHARCDRRGRNADAQRAGVPPRRRRVRGRRRDRACRSVGGPHRHDPARCRDYRHPHAADTHR